MLPFASTSTPVALLHAVTPSGNVAQLSTNRYDPESAAIDGRLAANWSTTAAHATAIRTRLITGSFCREVFGRCNPTRKRSNRRDSPTIISNESGLRRALAAYVE